jgi:hypothetical protein
MRWSAAQQGRRVAIGGLERKPGDPLLGGGVEVAEPGPHCGGLPPAGRCDNEGYDARLAVGDPTAEPGPRHERRAERRRLEPGVDDERLSGGVGGQRRYDVGRVSGVCAPGEAQEQRPLLKRDGEDIGKAGGELPRRATLAPLDLPHGCAGVADLLGQLILGEIQGLPTTLEPLPEAGWFIAA